MPSYQLAGDRYSTILPRRYRGKYLSNFRGFEDAARIANEAVLSNRSVFISGPCGTGKTHLAAALLIEWAGYTQPEKSREMPVFLPSVEFFSELKAAMDDKISDSEILDKYSLPPLLVVDDIGAEKVSDWSRQQFYTLLDRRYRGIRQTIITSNLDLGKLSELIDDRIASRVAEMGVVIALNGPDYRISKKVS